jgi:hypothetical protein
MIPVLAIYGIQNSFRSSVIAVYCCKNDLLGAFLNRKPAKPLESLLAALNDDFLAQDGC